MEIEEGYYLLNSSKKILYWTGYLWMKPRKDQQGRFGTWIEHLEKQPTNIKKLTPVEETEYAPLFRR